MAGWWQSHGDMPNGSRHLYLAVCRNFLMDKHFTTEYREKELLGKVSEGIASIESKHYRVVVLETLVSGVLGKSFQEAGIYSNYFFELLC